MTALGIDLGGTKVSFAVFSRDGELHHKETAAIGQLAGREVADLIATVTEQLLKTHKSISSIGIAVPGIYRHGSGSVWAPNIRGWDDYPLMQQMQRPGGIPVAIDSDRACYILGEAWMGNARGCRDAIYLAVGTGIGAGILTGGKILRGAHDIAGAIGWMALDQPYEKKYIPCGCFEYHASGEGLARVARELLVQADDYNGLLRKIDVDRLKAQDVFAAYEKKDPLAVRVIETAIRFWGMAIANLVSLFDPEKIILGGGVFGPALPFLPAIREEAARWAQPISMKLVRIQPSALGTDAGLYGAARLAWDQLP